MSTFKYIVVDGHSVLFSIPAFSKIHRINPRKARHLLLKILQQYQDRSDSKVCIVFDGKKGGEEEDSFYSLEVRYAESHQTADALIERAIARFNRPQEVVVVTADHQEGILVEGLGATCWSPARLFQEIK